MWIERENRAGTGAFVLWVLDNDAGQSLIEAEHHDSLESAKAAAERAVRRSLNWTHGEAWHLRE